MERRKGYNPKRCLANSDISTTEQRLDWAKKARYGGNSEHKSRPNDYDLEPPFNPRPGKSLCDVDRDFPKASAEQLLRLGFTRGMVSVALRNGWPQNVWAVRDGEAFEAQLENKELGIYHGYPMPLEDDFREEVLNQWSRRES